MMRRIGILGGTFDPLHLGHLDLASAAERALGLTGVIVMPSHVPPHRPAPVASAYHRFAMVSLAVNGRPGWEASDLELLDTSRSYTSATLQRLQRHGYAPEELFFLIGADAFKDIASWKDFPAILDQANFCVVARPGFPLQAITTTIPSLAARVRTTPSTREGDGTSIFLIDAKTADVSATAIRERLTRGESIADLVPTVISQHIAQHGLYRSVAPTRRSDGPH